MQRLGVDVARAVEAADVGIEVADGEPAFDDLRRDREMRCDLFLVEPLLAQSREGLELVHVIHRQPGDILCQGGLDGGSIIGALHDDAGYSVGVRRVLRH